ncbi:MAG: hypothetical protein P8N50_05270 [Actinomycetota bacterium]|jgi:hypothetical protein|nr:hypothetical protein [Actinomycetota bacterium]
MISRPWFVPGLATLGYLAGFNDEALHLIGQWWLDLGRWVQTAVVVVLLGLIVYLAADRLKERRSAHAAAVRATGASRPNMPTIADEVST